MPQPVGAQTPSACPPIGSFSSFVWCDTCNGDKVKDTKVKSAFGALAPADANMHFYYCDKN